MASKEMLQNITFIWSKYGRIRSKQPNEWLRRDMTNREIKLILSRIGLSRDEAIVTTKKGTWVHAELATLYEKYLQRGCYRESDIRVEGRYAFVELFGLGGSFAGESIIDASSVCIAKGKRWRLILGYAVCAQGKKDRIYLHREVMNAPDGLEVDHMNRDKIDNRLSNLRLATRGENGKNISLKINNKSGMAGVRYDKATNKWQVRITVDRKIVHIGRYKSLEDAMAARVNAELKYYGDFAPNRKVMINA